MPKDTNNLRNNFRANSEAQLYADLVRNRRFTLEDKKAFLCAIREHGFNVIYDMSTLRTILPSRSESEIKYLIEFYQRKSHQMLADRRRDQEKLPLVRWKRLLDLNLPSFFKKDDYSALLVSILRQFQVEHMQNPDHKSEMSDVYLFLSELAEGKYPAALSGSSALVLLSLLEGLSELIESDPRAAENSRLVLELFDKNSRIFQKIFLSKDVEAPDINEFLQYFDSISKDRLKQDLNKAKQQLANEIKRTPNQSEALSKEENPLHYYAMLPKIKRVQRCWNPLEVPVHDLKQQHESLVQNQSTDAESDSV